MKCLFSERDLTSSSGDFHAHRFVQLATVVGSVCSVSFLPFLLAGGFDQIRQILSRLFPFQRGLNHAYWAGKSLRSDIEAEPHLTNSAGNVWALYSALDRVLVKCTSTDSKTDAMPDVVTADLQWRGLPVSQAAVNSASRGLIGDITFGVLPEVKPVHCFLLTIACNAVRSAS